MSDAGTLFYLEDMANQKGATPAGCPMVDAAAGDVMTTMDDGADIVCASEGNGAANGVSGTIGICVGGHGKPSVAVGGDRRKRQSRARRAERYTNRLPLLDEDPLEEELPHMPPGEDARPLAPLTPLGKRLVGLVEWEADGVIRGV